MKKNCLILWVMRVVLFLSLAGTTAWLFSGCEKEKDHEDDHEVYVWISRFFKNEQNEYDYTMALYGDSIKLKEYSYDGDKTDCYIGQDNSLMKNVWDSAKAEIRIYREDELISTCRYDKEKYCDKSTSASVHYAFISDNDVYVRSVFYYDYENGMVTKTEIILWKNGEIIWRREGRLSWSGIGNIGTDLYWLIGENDGKGTHSLYKNGNLERTYENKYSYSDIMILSVLDGDLYRWMGPYHGADVWRNDELIFEDKERKILASGLYVFDGDWYLVGTYNARGRIFRNGELLYDIAVERDGESNPYYHVEMDGAYKHLSDIYSWGYIRVMDEENKQPCYQTIWKNGERWLSYHYPLNTGCIVSVFTK